MSENLLEQLQPYLDQDDYQYLGGVDERNKPSSRLENRTQGLPVAIAGDPKTFNYKGRLSREIKTPYLPELISEKLFPIFINILNSSHTENELLGLDDRSYNYLVQTCKLIVDFYEHQAREDIVDWEVNLVSNARRLLWTLRSLNQEKKQWADRLSLPVSLEELAHDFSISLSDIDELIPFFARIEQVLNISLDRSGLAANYTTSAAKHREVLARDAGFLSKFGTSDGITNEGMGVLDQESRAYKDRRTSANVLAKHLKGQGLRVRFTDLFKEIMNLDLITDGEALLDFSDISHKDALILQKIFSVTTAEGIQSLQELENGISCKDLSVLIQEQYTSRFIGMDWDETKKIGLALVRALKAAKLILPNGQTEDLSYTPLRKTDLEQSQQELLLLDLEDFIEKRVRKLKHEGQVKEIPAYINVLIMWLSLFPFLASVSEPIWDMTSQIGHIDFQYLKSVIVSELTEWGISLGIKESDLSHLFSDELGEEFFDVQEYGPVNTESSWSDHPDVTYVWAPSFDPEETPPRTLSDHLLPQSAAFWYLEEDSKVKWKSRRTVTLFPFEAVDTNFNADGERALLESVSWDELKDLTGFPFSFDDLSQKEARYQLFYDGAVYSIYDRFVVDGLEPQQDVKVPIRLDEDKRPFVLIVTESGDTVQARVEYSNFGEAYVRVFTDKQAVGKFVVCALEAEYNAPGYSISWERYGVDEETYSDTTAHQRQMMSSGQLVVEPVAPGLYALPTSYAFWWIPESGTDYLLDTDELDRLVEFTQQYINFSDLIDYVEDHEYQELSRTALAARIYEGITLQLVKQGFKYSQDTTFNNYLLMNDWEVTVEIARVFGLDCDGLSFVTSLFANAFTRFLDENDLSLHMKLWNSDQDINFPIKSLEPGISILRTIVDGKSSLHARPLLVDSLFETFEVSDHFLAAEPATLEDYEKVNKLLEEKFPEKLAKGRFAESAGIVMSFMGIISASLMAAALARKTNEKWQRRKRKKKRQRLELGKNGERRSRFDKSLYMLILPRLRKMSPAQLAAIPEVLTYLLSDEFKDEKMPESRSERRSRSIRILKGLQLQENSSSVEAIQSFRDVMKKIYYGGFVNDHVPDARYSLGQAIKSTKNPELREVLEVVQMLLGLRIEETAIKEKMQATRDLLLGVELADGHFDLEEATEAILESESEIGSEGKLEAEEKEEQLEYKSGSVDFSWDIED